MRPIVVSLARLVLPVGLLLAGACSAPAPAGPPAVLYTLRAPDADGHRLEVEAVVPSAGEETLELRMAVWSPGYYKREDYASRIEEMVAETPEGQRLVLESKTSNRWRVRTAGHPSVVLRYRLRCDEQSVTTNWVSPDLAVINGPATFITRVEKGPRPHEVRLEGPASWPRVATALEAVTAGEETRYRAPSYDVLADSPILAGNLSIREFDVEGSLHVLADGGAWEDFPVDRAAQDLARMARGTRDFWGFLPFPRYVFLDVHREGGGGLEHADSTLVTVQPSRLATPEGYEHWLGLVAHEYFHAFNVKRLRPIELGPFDYETPPETASLWVSEGLTSYFAELVLRRSGLTSTDDYLATLSRRIRKLQETPGRRVQSLEEASRRVWATSKSGLAENEETTVSYYVKGPVVGFLLDAEIQRRTGGVRDLGDVIRWAYQRYSGARGFTAEEFREAVSRVSGHDLEAWLDRALAGTEELDYGPALHWYGLRFADQGDPWTLEIAPDRTRPQRLHLESWLGRDESPADGG